jgi:putative transposase
LAEVATEWEFSSARDYAGLRNGKLINREVAGEFVDF